MASTFDIAPEHREPIGLAFARADRRNAALAVAAALAIHLAFAGLLAGDEWRREANAPTAEVETPVEIIDERDAPKPAPPEPKPAEPKPDPKFDPAAIDQSAPKPPPDKPAEAKPVDQPSPAPPPTQAKPAEPPKPAPQAKPAPAPTKPTPQPQAQPAPQAQQPPPARPAPQSAEQPQPAEPPPPQSQAAGLAEAPTALEASDDAESVRLLARMPTFAAPDRYGASRAFALKAEKSDDYKALVYDRLRMAQDAPEPGADGDNGGPPPKMATVVVGFSIDDRGAAVAIRILQSAGLPDIDRKGLAIIQRAAPFPPPPPGVARSFTPSISVSVE